MISDVATAIMTKFNETPAGDALRAVLTGGLWRTEADPKVTYPYAVFKWDSSDVDEIAGTRLNAIEHAIYTFSIFSKNDDGALQIDDIGEKFITLYDWTELTYPVTNGYKHFAVQRLSSNNRGKLDNVWMYDLQYDIQFQHS